MAQNKEQLDKLLQFISAIIKDPGNEEFTNKLRALVSPQGETNAFRVSDNKHLDEIYEFCIEKIIHQHAVKFYIDFPIESIKSTLIADFVRMEHFRRKDNFGDFCLAMYQQIEGMTNKICESRELSDITEKMWGHSAYIKSGKDIVTSITNRSESSNYTIASLLFPGYNSKSGSSYALEKSKMALQSLYAMDKVKTILYFLGYEGMMKSGDYDAYRSTVDLLTELYQCRNMNHRGNTLKPKEEETINKVLPQKEIYYFKFLGMLVQYVEYIKRVYPKLKEILKSIETLEDKKVKFEGPKVIDKIDLGKINYGHKKNNN